MGRGAPLDGALGRGSARRHVAQARGLFGPVGFAGPGRAVLRACAGWGKVGEFEGGDAGLGASTLSM